MMTEKYSSEELTCTVTASFEFRGSSTTQNFLT